MESAKNICHTYLVFGVVVYTELMLSARHKAVKNALRYKHNAGFLLELAWLNKT
jgi:hypothetical protein